MRYFTPEIWAGWQAKGAAYDRAERAWKRNLSLYNRSLKKIAPRLGARQAKFFTGHSLHDGHLLTFTISDLPPRNVKRKPHETSVRMEVLSGWSPGEIYELRYTGVKEIQVQTKNSLFPLDHSRFGDWGYDELLPEGKTAFRHNILFQTGTEISLVFERFAFSRKKSVSLPSS